MADPKRKGLEGQRRNENNGDQSRWDHERPNGPIATQGAIGGLANSNSGECVRLTNGEERQPNGEETGWQQGNGEPSTSSEFQRLADSNSNGREQEGGSVTAQECNGVGRNTELFEGQSATGPTNGFWRDADWLFCRDGKWRPVESGTFPLVDGLARGMGYGSDPITAEYAQETQEARKTRLKGYGNAIIAQVAQAFIESYVETELEK